MKVSVLFACVLTAACVTTSASSFAEKELDILVGDGLSMGATLTLPDDNEKPKAVIILATGSGIQNRDEEIMGKKPFKTLAEFLSANGYAVLRVDDRGFANIADAANATVDTDMQDVAAAVSAADSIYPSLPLGIIGHSYGGNSAIRNAVNNPQVDFIVTLAATAWSGDSLIMSQSRTLATMATGRWDGEVLQRQLMSIAKSPLPDIPARLALTLAMTEAIGEAAKLPAVQKQIDAQVSPLLSPWYRSMLRYDPAGDIVRVRIPWLALNGSKDTQVLPSNLDTFKALNPTVETHVIEGHNHLFQPCSTGMIQEYTTIPGDISPETLSVIRNWLDRLTEKAPAS